MMKENWSYRRGDVYLANLNPVQGSEQGGIRPVLVLQNNVGNLYCPTLIVAPITSKLQKKPNQPTHYPLENVKGLDCTSVALLAWTKPCKPAWAYTSPKKWKHRKALANHAKKQGRRDQNRNA